ncbi:DNA/RNA non-specific endonuclease [Burkholderia sp. Ac-20379]|uniref:DNA/RNA non-specific endonuclease n=1 Tax=Burkholderia sp. Ac-20379 TaxID=2703900 RepID=UPI00197D1C1C|nr:DNA/RNA non-specific endonuclease [Burkholderia sp. Ac-20379]MBN3725807.1 DNA/RNA non-specific endonuclease [Burkholderia sp. Ac-20379]
MKWLAALCALTISATAFASSCPQFSPSGQEPELTNPKMARQTRLICYSDFVVLHSGVTHTPLWSAEHLTAAHLADAKDEVRTNRFFVERRLPAGDSATLADYRRSGYDRGHLSPAGDRWNDQAMAESFSLANMIPQNPQNNRRLWAHVEEAVRAMAVRNGEAYVVTGPMFHGSELQTIGESRVIVPTEIFKLVYLPSKNTAFAIVVKNVNAKRYDIETVHELEAASGLRFPGVPERLKDSKPGGLSGV